MKTRLIASCAALVALLSSGKLLAHEPGTSICGKGGCTAPVPGGVTFQARLGAAYVWNDLRSDDERFVFDGFGPSGALVVGLATSRHFAFDLDVPVAVVPAGTLTHDGFETTGDASFVALSPSAGFTLYTVSGWYFRPTFGATIASTSFGDTIDLDDSAWGPAVSLAFGWETVVASPWASGGALRLQYSHIGTKTEGSNSVDMAQNVVALSFELSLAAY